MRLGLVIMRIRILHLFLILQKLKRVFRLSVDWY